MKVSYKKLFNILKNRGITKTALGNALDLSSTTLAKLAKDEQISMNTLIGICNYLNCQPGDIMEVRYEIDKDTLLYRLTEEKNAKLKGSIYHQTQIKLAYNSNHIEGSRLTEDQTRYIYETNTIGFDKEPVNIDDIMETINHFQCFDYMIECANNTLDEEFIKNVHKILKTNTSDSRISWFNVGEYKSRRNMVGDMKTVPPEKVKDEMNKLLEEYWKKQNITLEDILDVHVRFERIHPFQDGNGRVGRIIIFKECLKHNIVPFIIEDNLKFFYYRGLKEWDNEKGYLMDTCLTAQDRYKAYLDYFEIKYEKYV
ncbi:Fic family protein [Eubacterium ventriosum]|uniref:Fic family protein n=1 Tax=Eubacterium ventriosum TaxID=39496 RepID=UPI002432A190|nr:Fic family protein [Eubacterium ventriosum]